MADYFYSIEMLVDWLHFASDSQMYVLTFAHALADEENQ